MRFALKVLPLAALGCAAALLVACGDRNGLLSGSEAGSLQDALAAAQSACSAGEAPSAELAAQRFSDRVAALPPGTVDPQLIENLQEGASTLSQLVSGTCTETATTTTTPTTVTTTPPTTATTTTTTTPTEPTTPTQTVTPPPPPVTTAPVPPPDDGGGDPGNGLGNGGGTPGGGQGNGNGPPSENPGGAAPDFGGGDD